MRLKSSWLFILLGLTACSKPSAETHLRRANDLLAQSRTREAIVEYRVAAQLSPKRGDVRMRLSQAYERIGDREMVTEAVRAADLLPQDVDAQLRAGRLLLAGRAFEDAKARAEKAIVLAPRDPKALILLGNVMAGMKDFDGALTDYQDAIALNNGDQLAAYGNIATLQNARGAKSEAEANFRKAIEVAPTSLPAREALASFLWTTRRITEAEKTLKDALALAPTDLSLNRALGNLYVVSNRVKEAEAFFQKIAAPSNPPIAALALADYYHFAHRIDDARHVLRELSAKDATYAPATLRLAALDASEGLLAQGMARTQQVLDKHPEDMLARLLKARLLFADGKQDEAVAIARSIPSTDPNASAATDAFMLIGAIESERGESGEAIKAYQQVLSRQSQRTAALTALANLNLGVGSLDKAATYANQAVSVEPTNPIARSMMVRVWLAQGKADQASAELARLQKDFPNSPRVLDLVAKRQLLERQPGAARAAYMRAAALAPNDVEAATGLVQLDLASGNVAAAIARVEVALKQARPSPAWFALAASTYVSAHDYGKAESALKRAIEVEPSRLSNYAFLGQLLASEQRLDEARVEFERIVQSTPRSIPANTMLAILFQLEGKMDVAEQRYRAVLAIDDRAAVAANNLAWIDVANHRRLDEALQLAQTAVSQAPEDPHANDTLGWIFYEKGSYREAIPYLETSVRNSPPSPVLIYHLGMAYYKDGLWDKAKSELSAAVASKVPFEGIDEAKRALAVLH
jgi:tetratricopeptide (TPR) repeat protein